MIFNCIKLLNVFYILMAKYNFDLYKFKNIMVSNEKNEEEYTSDELINAIVQSFNIKTFVFYDLLESLKYYMKEIQELKIYFSYTFYFILKAFLIMEENVDENSEQIISINKKMSKIWDSIPNDTSIQFKP